MPRSLPPLTSVAICPHCKRAVAAFTHNVRKDDQDTYLLEWERAGLEIVRMTDEEFRRTEWRHSESCFYEKTP
jgi:hypothetical protein